MATGLPASKKYIKDFQKPLRFAKDGKFRILHLTDIHEVDPEMDDDEDKSIPAAKTTETMHVIEECLDRTNPDLVVFGGDNISGFWKEFTYDYMYKTIKRIVEPVAKRNIPLAIVFGNHDAECEYMHPFMSKENQIRIYSEYENFRGTMNDEDVFGCCNCSLPVLSSDGSHTAWNIWCIDSNDYIRDEKHNQIQGAGYGYVHEDQIEWYEKRAEELKAANGGKCVPSVLFQHIPVKREFSKFVEVPEKGENTVSLAGRYYTVPDDAFVCGELHESPCPPNDHDEQFDSWVRTGDIVAAIFGHDHVNSFTMEIDGIQLIQTPGAGYHTYGGPHGGRLIVLDENIPDRIETQIIYVDRITEADIK